MKRRSKPSRLVIDACVLRAAGELDVSSSLGCRLALESVYEANHRAVVTPTLLGEWDKRQSKFALRWRAAMVSFRRLDFVDGTPMESLRQRISTGLPQRAKREAALNDVHLVEAALRAGKSIVSQEKKSRKLFAEVPGQPKILDGIAWVDPVVHRAEAVTWLESGARATGWPH